MPFQIKRKKHENWITNEENYGFKRERKMMYSTQKPMKQTTIRGNLLRGAQS